jgi:hypothetical protein
VSVSGEIYSDPVFGKLIKLKYWFFWFSHQYYFTTINLYGLIWFSACIVTIFSPESISAVSNIKIGKIERETKNEKSPFYCIAFQKLKWGFRFKYGKPKKINKKNFVEVNNCGINKKIFRE